MNTLLSILPLVIIVSATIICIMYVSKKTKTPEIEIPPIENPEVLTPTLPTGSLSPKPVEVEVLEPLKEVIAPAPKPKRPNRRKKPNNNNKPKA